MSGGPRPRSATDSQGGVALIAVSNAPSVRVGEGLICRRVVNEPDGGQ